MHENFSFLMKKSIWLIENDDFPNNSSLEQSDTTTDISFDMESTYATDTSHSSMDEHVATGTNVLSDDSINIASNSFDEPTEAQGLPFAFN